ncbi:MAG TPA: Ig-like domain-containing protein [Phycisphaerae bacterium]|nr:Ig-like domain-containing protein [Phycisphaerae bacterium]
MGLSAVAGVGLWVQSAAAGGGAHNVVVLIDPTDADSLYLGNYYVAARRIPSRNVVYLSQDAWDYAALVNDPVEAMLGELSNRGLEDHIDYAVLASGRVYRVPASGYVTEVDCSVVDHFSVSAAYTLAHLSNAVLAGDSTDAFGLTSTEPNQYFSTTDAAVAFSGGAGWQGGSPSSAAGAPRYLVGALLGYTGLRGNTPAEVVAQIDRSVAADGTRPAGTFYYMKTTDEARSSPRDPFFPDAISSISTLGGQAVQIDDVLPNGHHDCLGIMTGWPNPRVGSADVTLLPGSYGDHLTSWAATFDKSPQTKVSMWIAEGASGSHGTVEEPCAVPGKFPHPRVYVYYFQGLSLGESLFRSLEYLPYQGLIYGDPLTQPFAYIPTVEVPDAPSSPVSGVVPLTPQATTAKPGAGIARLDLVVDGVVEESINLGESFLLDTASLGDGPHDVRVVAFDDSPVATQGRWMRWIETDNAGRSVSLDVQPAVGGLSTPFTLQVASTSGVVSEIRVLQNHRVVAATGNARDTLLVNGSVLGAGPVRLVAEAEFSDGRVAYSEASTLGIAFGGACCLPDGACRQLTLDACAESCGGAYAGDGTSCNAGLCSRCQTGDFDTNGSVDLADFAGFQTCLAGPGAPPPDDPPGLQAACVCAFDFDDDLDVDLEDYGALFELLTGPCPVAVNVPPVAYGYTKDIRGYEPSVVELPAADVNGDALTYTILTPPAQASLTGSGPTRVLRPNGLAAGTDSLEFIVEDSQGASDVATVTLAYPIAPPSHFTIHVGVLGEAKARISSWPPSHAGLTSQTAPFTAWYDNDGGTVTLTAPDSQGVSPFIHWVVDGEVGAFGDPEAVVSLDHHVKAVATYLSCRKLSIRANRPGAFISVFPNDKDGQGGGTAPIDRIYLTGTETVVSIAPPAAGGHAFRYWKLDGVNQDPGDLALVTPNMDTQHLAVAIYQQIPGDADDDGDVDAEDVAGFQQCFSGDFTEPGFDPPSSECSDSFDKEPPGGDGDVDLLDYAGLFQDFTGPF